MNRSLALLPLLALAACPWGRTERVVTEPTPELSTVVDGNTAFAVDMYGWMAAEDEGNLFFSPFSMSSALSMTYAGAGSDTATEMAEVLHVSGDEADWHEAFGALTRDLNGDMGRGYTLHIANRIFGQTGFPWKQPFLDVNDLDYGAPLEELDYNADPEAAREHINAWVADQTQDLIDELLKPGVVGVDTRMVLTNAIYFLGDWQAEFDPDLTTDQAFFAPAGEVSAPLMHQTGPFELGYDAEAEVSVLRMPYVDDEVSMLVILPDADDGLADVEAQLSSEALAAWSASLVEQEVEVFLPKLEMRYELSMKDALSDLGMPKAFDEVNADFSGMVDTAQHQLYISDVVHEAYVRVDEEGTEAAAATAVVVNELTSVVETELFRADHPYLFLIQDDLTGSVLFMGRVVDPS